jgi:hypothetical protein
MSTRRLLVVWLVVAGLLLLPAVCANAGMVSAWRFDEGSGTGVADSVGSNSGTLKSGAATWTTGVLGGALSFDGTTNFSVPDATALNPDGISISCWFKGPSDSRSWVGYVDKMTGGVSGYAMGMTAGVPQFTLFHGDGWENYYELNAPSTKSVTDNQWHLVTATFKQPTTTGNNAAIYVDGVKAVDGEEDSPIVVDSFPLLIGGGLPSTNLVIGALDDMGIWTQSLSAGEVKALYDFGKSGAFHYSADKANQFFDSYEGAHGDVNINGAIWSYHTGLGSTLGLTGQTLVLDDVTGAGYTTTAAVPEPGATAMLLSATIALLAYAWRRRRT